KENKEREIERKYLEAENKRKSLELEEARKLQLSILPKCFPEIRHLEIFAEMRTAAEVGGDYYDYHLSSDGTVTLTLGDATGHGIKAGILVTLIKSLFDAMAHTFFIPDFFNHCTRTIRKMNLGNLYMGLTVLKIQEYKITASAAGMPPFLIFRQNTNSIEEIILKGMPLGAYPEYPYQQKIFKVNPGDTILLLTDGFVELFNANREMLDMEMAKNIFMDSVRNNSSNVISDLLSAADKWLNGFQQADDISFLVIKIK
ncbi:MAG: PP2C family protein-serine/threonine phosphatase, partial [Ignavibacteria bacterium]